jgi:uncharacterized protein YdeI (YjbR/CyaY-like superfamily)
MGARDPRIDAYIEKAADFARPILRHLRDVVHSASPEIDETMKWSFPHFTHRGIVCSMAAFKEHCTLGFWKASLILPDDEKGEEAMGQFGRITSLDDLPPRETLVGYVREAVRLNDEGVKVERSPKRKRARELEVPEAFRAALDRDPKAKATFEGFSRSHRNEYVEWITEARRDETRDRRIRTAIEWLAEGKPRNWKYTKG